MKEIDMPQYRPEFDRFWEKVDRRSEDECWPWRAGITSEGYGAFVRTGRIRGYAHRWSYEHHVGPIPKGMVIDHRCHNRTCVNPAHLRAVTQYQNIENHSGPTKASSTGVRGVYFETRTQRWVAQVRAKDDYYMKRFPTMEEAADAVVEARNRIFTHNDLDRTHIEG